MWIVDSVDNETELATLKERGLSLSLASLYSGQTLPMTFESNLKASQVPTLTLNLSFNLQSQFSFCQSQTRFEP